MPLTMPNVQQCQMCATCIIGIVKHAQMALSAQLALCAQMALCRMHNWHCLDKWHSPLAQMAL